MKIGLVAYAGAYGGEVAGCERLPFSRKVPLFISRSFNISVNRYFQYAYNKQTNKRNKDFKTILTNVRKFLLHNKKP